jgi:hypothetical protein
MDPLSFPVLMFCVSRLSQMILDKVLNGVLDQGNGCVILFDEPEEDVSESRRPSFPDLNPHLDYSDCVPDGYSDHWSNRQSG